jgi:hypothetical protein
MIMNGTSIEQNDIEIKRNYSNWQKKHVLQKIIRKIADRIVELGSGIGNLKMVLPECICTVIFPNLWIDRVENTYQLYFTDQSISNLILFDVFHHLEFPAVALNEFQRIINNYLVFNT